MNLHACRVKSLDAVWLYLSISTLLLNPNKPSDWVKPLGQSGLTSVRTSIYTHYFTFLSEAF
jgi:hypothetical protein